MKTKNRTLKNSNIVVEEVYIRLDSPTGETKISIPEIVTQGDDLSIVALVQTENLEITGAKQINL